MTLKSVDPSVERLLRTSWGTLSPYPLSLHGPCQPHGQKHVKTRTKCKILRFARALGPPQLHLGAIRGKSVRVRHSKSEPQAILGQKCERETL